MLIGEFYSAKPQRTSCFSKCTQMPSQPQVMVILLALEPSSQQTTGVHALRGVEPSSPDPQSSDGNHCVQPPKEADPSKQLSFQTHLIIFASESLLQG